MTSKLFSALARRRVAIVASVAEMIGARIAGVTLTGFLRHVAITAMGKALVLDGGGGLLGQRADEYAGQSDNPLSHRVPHGLPRQYDIAVHPMRTGEASAFDPRKIRNRASRFSNLVEQL
jgi:hypothetical protein